MGIGSMANYPTPQNCPAVEMEGRIPARWKACGCRMDEHPSGECPKALTRGTLRPSDPARTLAKAAEKLGIPMPSGADIWPHQCRMGRAAARMSRKQLAAASGVSERTITAFEHHTSRSITRANNVALRRALEAANVGFLGFGIKVPDRRVPVPPTDEAREKRVADALFAVMHGMTYETAVYFARTAIAAYEAP